MKTFLFIFIAIPVMALSPEELFVQARTATLNGQDSLALCLYEQVYRQDSGSVVVQEILATCYVQKNLKAEALKMLHKVADHYEATKDWSKVTIVYRDLYKLTRNHYDAGCMAMALFYDGIITGNSAKVNAAEQVWQGLIDRALLKGMPSQAERILDFQIQVHKDVLKHLHNNNVHGNSDLC
jgi:tetratricopeptide (TPR) repeat protein